MARTTSRKFSGLIFIDFPECNNSRGRRGDAAVWMKSGWSIQDSGLAWRLQRLVFRRYPSRLRRGPGARSLGGRAASSFQALLLEGLPGRKKQRAGQVRLGPSLLLTTDPRTFGSCDVGRGIGPKNDRMTWNLKTKHPIYRVKKSFVSMLLSICQ